MTVQVDTLNTRAQISRDYEWISLSMEEALQVRDALGRWLGFDDAPEPPMESPYSNSELHSAEAR